MANFTRKCSQQWPVMYGNYDWPMIHQHYKNEDKNCEKKEVKKILKFYTETANFTPKCSQPWPIMYGSYGSPMIHHHNKSEDENCEKLEVKKYWSFILKRLISPQNAVNHDQSCAVLMTDLWSITTTKVKKRAKKKVEVTKILKFYTEKVIFTSKPWYSLQSSMTLLT